MKEVASKIQALIGNVQDGCDTLNAKRTSDTLHGNHNVINEGSQTTEGMASQKRGVVVNPPPPY